MSKLNGSGDIGSNNEITWTTGSPCWGTTYTAQGSAFGEISKQTGSGQIDVKTLEDRDFTIGTHSSAVNGGGVRVSANPITRDIYVEGEFAYGLISGSARVEFDYTEEGKIKDSKLKSVTVPEGSLGLGVLFGEETNVGVGTVGGVGQFGVGLSWDDAAACLGYNQEIRTSVLAGSITALTRYGVEIFNRGRDGYMPTSEQLVTRARNNPDGPEAAMVRALESGDTVAAAQAAAHIPEFSDDRIIRVAAGYEGADTSFPGTTSLTGKQEDDLNIGLDNGSDDDDDDTPSQPNSSESPDDRDERGVTTGGLTGGAGGTGLVGAGPGFEGSGRGGTTTTGGSTGTGSGVGTGPGFEGSGRGGSPTTGGSTGTSSGVGTGTNSGGADAGQAAETGGFREKVPVLLDLDGNGVKVTDLSRSTVFVVSDDGLEHRTAWAGAGDGVLFYDVGGDGQIKETREYVFTEWDPTARSDFEALRARFDSNNDGKLTSADALFSQFKVMVTKPDGSQEAQTLTQLGITSIDLTGDTTHIRLPDGSVITGQSTFTMGGVQMTAADVTLMAESIKCVTLSTWSQQTSTDRLYRAAIQI